MKKELIIKKIKELNRIYKDAKISFCPETESFQWKGDFDDAKTEYIKKEKEMSLSLKKDDDAIIIEYYYHTISVNDLSLFKLPQKMILNNTVLLSDILFLSPEREEINNALTEYFENGIAIDYNRFSSEMVTKLKIFFWGYFTFRRFLRFIERDYSKFYLLSERYKEKSIGKIFTTFLDKTFQTVEELETRLRKAIDSEDYEKAAMLRDRIRELKSR